jgi:uncharacterized repeat protein (TIGR01451 family)
VRITDRLPDGVRFISASRGCTEDAGTVTCDVGILASGEATQVQIGVRATQPGAAENTASVRGTEPDPDLNNNADTATTQVNAAPNSADLAIDKQAPPTANYEENFTYALTVANDGPDAAAGVVVEDDLPDGVGFVSSDECDPPNGQGVVICNLGTLNSGATVEVSIVVKAEQPGPQRNFAMVSSDTADPADTNNRSSEVTTTVAALADLAIDKEASAEVVDEDRFVYRIEVTNDGPSDANAVRVTDELPEGVRFISASGGCVRDAGTVRCDFATLASGETGVVRIHVTAKKPGELRNTATVRSEATDPGPISNADTEATRARAAPKPNLLVGCEATPGSGEVIKGTKGDDVLRGTPGYDTIFGFGGDDTIEGGGGDDTIRGGTGTDAIEGGSGRDKVYGEGGHDALEVSDGKRGDSASGGTGTDACSPDRSDRVTSCP